MRRNIESIIEELEQIRGEWEDHATNEKLGGNVVKEAHYKGTAAGVLIAINILRQESAETPAPGN